MIDRVALMVESQDEFVAWASYERWPGRNEAEAAFMVGDNFQGRGIATLLLEHLAAIARSNGIDRFTAEVLGDNRAMLAVFTKAGWPLQRRFESGVVDLDWDLAPTDEFLDSVERREQRADARAIARLLLPRAIAVIGASDVANSVGAALWENIVDSVDVPVYPVNPRLSELDGHRCFDSTSELPDDVSLAVIAVPPASIEATIDMCIAKRMRGAVIVTDLDGSGIDVSKLVTRSRRNGLRLIGPSSMGIASPLSESRLQAALVDVSLPAGNVAISLQSGSLGGSVLRHARDLQLGISWFVSLGDKSDVSSNDLLQFWEDDGNTRVIAMYTESFGNPRKFARIARRVSHTVPIVAVRTGAAADGALGGTLFQQAGVIEVPTVHALLDTARVLASQPILRGKRVAVVTNSRSPATLAEAALRTAGLEPSRSHGLRVDATAEDFGAAVSADLASADIDGVLVIHAPAVASDLDSDTANAVHDAASGATKPVVAVVLGGSDGPLQNGSAVPAFGFPEQAAAVLGRSYAYGQWLATESQAQEVPVREIDPSAAQSLIKATLQLDDRDSSRERAPEPLLADTATQRELLRTYGILMAPAAEATPQTAVAVARSIGYPVAVKATRRGIGRSVKAGIALDLIADDDVIESVSQICEALGDDANELIVQAMTSPGLEVRVRCEHDDRLGVIVSVGLGGAQADVIDDRTTRLAPVSPASAVAMLAETKVAAALAAGELDSSSLVDVICLAAQLASDHPDVAELDLNPIIVSASEAVVTDAVVRLEAHVRSDGPLRKLST
jgi:acyl-CoA synthetase (NDP forming)